MTDSAAMLEGCQINNYQINEQLGSGEYGLAFRVNDIFTNKNYALKILLKNNEQTSYRLREADINPQVSHSMIKDEIRHFFRLNHNNLHLPYLDLEALKNLSRHDLYHLPDYKEICLQLKVCSNENIVTIRYVMECSFAIFIIMDYYPLDLFTAIVQDKIFANNGLLVKKVFLQIGSAIHYCHEMGVYHCDVKPENILLDADYNIYLCDFGLSTMNEYLSPNVSIGTSFYMSPERILYFDEVMETSGKSSNKRKIQFPTLNADIWSLGIILINLTCIKNPWLRAHQTDAITFRYFIEDNKVLMKILPITNEFFNLLVKILKLNPLERIDLDSLMIEICNIKSFTTAQGLNNVPILTTNSMYDSINGTPNSSAFSFDTDDEMERIYVATNDNRNEYSRNSVLKDYLYSYVDEVDNNSINTLFNDVQVVNKCNKKNNKNNFVRSSQTMRGDDPLKMHSNTCSDNTIDGNDNQFSNKILNERKDLNFTLDYSRHYQHNDDKLISFSTNSSSTGLERSTLVSCLNP